MMTGDAGIPVEDPRVSTSLQTLQSGVPDDLLIVSASFEDRCSTVIDHLPSDYSADRSVVYVNTDFIDGRDGERTRRQLYRLIENAARHSEHVIVAEGSLFDPVRQLDALRMALLQPGSHEEGSALRVKIDTTTFNREALLVCCGLLRTSSQPVKMRLHYVSPKTHGKWLSRGFRQIRNIMGFSGIQHPGRQTALVVLAGFEGERVLKVIEEHEPRLVMLGIGDPPTSKEFLDRNLGEQQLILSRQEVSEFRFPTTDIIECCNRLEEKIAALLSEYNVVLAPMSTKLSTIGTMLFAERHPEVQITYCVPGEYNVLDYSTGAHRLFSETIDQ